MTDEGQKIGFPKSCFMPQLTRNYLRLNNFTLLSDLFLKAPFDDQRYRQLRSALVFRLMKGARNYMLARQHVLDQIAEGERYRRAASGPVAFPIFEFADAFDDCLADLYGVIRLIEALEELRFATSEIVALRVRSKQLFTDVRTMRSKSQHIHQLIVNNDLEGGPVRPAVSLNGNFALLGPFRVDLVSLGHALETLFDAVCSLFPDLDPLNIPTTVSNGSR